VQLLKGEPGMTTRNRAFRVAGRWYAERTDVNGVSQRVACGYGEEGKRHAAEQLHAWRQARRDQDDGDLPRPDVVVGG
jgi:hypothetical protein